MKAIATAKLAVMREVTHTEKDGKMQGGQSYRYRSVEAVLAALRPALVQHGLTFRMAKTEIIDRTPLPTKSGGSFQSATVAVTFELTHAESGEKEEGQSIGKGTDALDKEYNKALTAAEKQFLLKTFLLDTEDDPDHESSERPGPEGQASQKPGQGSSQGQQPSQPSQPAKESGSEDAQSALSPSQLMSMEEWRKGVMDGIAKATGLDPVADILATIKEKGESFGMTQPQRRKHLLEPILRAHFSRAMDLCDSLEKGDALLAQLDSKDEPTVERLLGTVQFQNVRSTLVAQQELIKRKLANSVYA